MKFIYDYKYLHAFFFHNFYGYLKINMQITLYELNKFLPYRKALRTVYSTLKHLENFIKTYYVLLYFVR